MTGEGSPGHNRTFPSEIVAVTSPAPRTVWQRAYDADPRALVTQSPQWMDVMADLGTWRDASIAFELGGGRSVVLPLAKRALGGRWGMQASFSEGWGMGGLIGAGGITAAEVAAVLEHLSKIRAVQISIRPNPELGTVWADGARGSDVLRIAKRAHVLDLTGGADAVFSTRFDKNGRRDVRRAERLGVEVVVDTAGALVPAFYDMFIRSLLRWAEQSREPRAMALYRGRRRDPIEKFEAMARHLGDAMRLHVAYVEGVPAAAAIVLSNGANAHYTRGVMDVDVAGRTNATDLVQWSAIREAAAGGCKAYHMGESGTSRSLSRFKEKFGAEPVPYALYRLERLPATRVDMAVREAVKRVIGFRDA